LVQKEWKEKHGQIWVWKEGHGQNWVWTFVYDELGKEEEELPLLQPNLQELNPAPVEKKHLWDGMGWEGGQSQAQIQIQNQEQKDQQQKKRKEREESIK
jgi:hypothetical protein